MKKLIALVLVIAMVAAFAGCAGKPTEPATPSTEPATPSTDAPASNGGVDLSSYPAALHDWTAADLNRYFVEAGAYPADDEYVYEQDHANYYAGTGIGVGAGYMSDTILIAIFTTADPAVESGVDEFVAHVKETHDLGEDLGNMPVDHMIDGVMFLTSYCMEEDVYNAAEAAIAQLADALGITPDF